MVVLFDLFDVKICWFIEIFNRVTFGKSRDLKSLILKHAAW